MNRPPDLALVPKESVAFSAQTPVDFEARLLATQTDLFRPIEPTLLLGLLKKMALGSN